MTKITIDTDKNLIYFDSDEETTTVDLYSTEGFELISQIWLKTGWNQKYTYTFSWMGRPIIQLPQDMFRLQEVIYQIKPNVIIETGVAHGGSLMFYASLFKAMGGGKVIGVDIHIRQMNREAIESHELYPFIELIEGDSTEKKTIEQVNSLVKPADKVLVVLDSNHSKQHVLLELEAYSKFVTPKSYIVATDGFMGNLHDVPRGNKDWIWNNPFRAAMEFLSNHPEFNLESPNWPFNESGLRNDVTHWPGAWLRRIN